jgi:hypothetical protein
MSLHVYILPLFWINQSLVFLINMMCLEKKNKHQVFVLTRPGTERTIYYTWNQQSDHYTIDAVNNIVIEW